MTRNDSAAPSRVVFVRLGSNNYEWLVFLNDKHVATLPTQEKAAGFADGYTLGLRHGQEMT